MGRHCPSSLLLSTGHPRDTDCPIRFQALAVATNVKAVTPPSRRRTRRELLKMAPLAAAGILFTEGGRDWLLASGLSLAERAAMLAFSTSHLAPTFGDHEVTPLDRFPLNSYLADDPEVDLDEWRLEV